MARFGAPALLRRACALDHVHLPLAAGLTSDAAVGWLPIMAQAGPGEGE